jgi:alkylation response protein AidB-like acyl-CoA dehydrogenase
MCEYVDVLATDEQRKRMFAPVLDEGGLFQTMGSEPTSSPSYGLHMGTTLAARPGGYVLNGVKHFCTMGGAATHGLAFCVLDDGEGPANMATAMRIAVIPTDSPGVTYFGEWNPLGMRGSVSPSVRLEDVWVDPDQVISNPLFAGVSETFGIGQVMALLGATGNAFDHAVEYFRSTQLATSDKSMAHEEVIQRHMGSIAAHLAAGRSIAMEAARKVESATAAERAVLAMQAKYIGTKAALHVTDALLQVVGARSIKRGSPIERAYRDVRTASLMPPNFDVMERVMGTSTLGIGAEVFRTADDKE